MRNDDEFEALSSDRLAPIATHNVSIMRPFQQRRHLLVAMRRVLAVTAPLTYSPYSCVLGDEFRGRMSTADNNLSPKARLALWGSTWRLAGLATAVAVNVAWISLLAYGLVKLL